MIAELQELIETSFPSATDQVLVRGIKEGIVLADHLRSSDPILRTPIGNDLAGHIRRAGVMWRLQDLSIRGELPFSAQIEVMPIGNWHHLEIKASESIVAHVCKTDAPLSFPKDTPNRQDERLTNQPDLFMPNVVSIRQVVESSAPKCVWLTYGTLADGSITHVCWGMPTPPTVAENWLAHVNVLARMRSTGDQMPLKERVVDPTALMKFKRDIGEALNNSDEAKDQE
jgi:hypothetical protein